MKNKPLISIIITAYNYAQYIDDAIKSALEQTYDNFEVIIVDDGSTDNTEEIVSPYKEKVRYIKQNNRGLPSARNTGIMNAKGDWILPLDADDRISPVYLDRIAETITPEIDIIYCDLQHFGNRTDKVEMKAPISKESFKNFNPLSYCSAIRKDCLLECGGYNVKFKYGWEDYALWIELFLRNKNFTRIPEAHFFYHKHGTSMIDTSYRPEAVQYSNKLLKEIYPSLYV